GVPESEEQRRDAQQDGGSQGRQGIDALQDGLRLDDALTGARLVPDPSQRPAGQTAGRGLTELASPRVGGIHGGVIALTGADLLAVDDVGDEGPDEDVQGG